nr:hypothetical protein [Tanacetum cinerariifolium]
LKLTTYSISFSSAAYTLLYAKMELGSDGDGNRESCSDGDGRENGRKKCREKGGKHCAGHSVLNRNVTGVSTN